MFDYCLKCDFCQRGERDIFVTGMNGVRICDACIEKAVESVEKVRKDRREKFEDATPEWGWLA